MKRQTVKRLLKDAAFFILGFAVMTVLINIGSLAWDIYKAERPKLYEVRQ
jgi:hypothetical protein